MDEIITRYYRQIVRMGFENCGKLETPSIFMDSSMEKLHPCNATINGYMHLYINIRDNIIENVKYLCLCEPTSNVAVELLCIMIKGKTIEEVEAITETSFIQMTGSKNEEFLKKAKGILDLFSKGLTRYKTDIAQSF